MQRIYIAGLKNPWTVGTARTELSHSEYPWEEVGDLNSPVDPPHVNVNEGPEVLKHGGKLFLIYSASGCWTDHYALGMLAAKEGSNLLDAHSWTKTPTPVLTESADAHAFGTGHNGFFQSPDGSQNWIIYHANPEPHQGCGAHRSPRAQPFTWNPDGSPNFGQPVSIDQEIPAPSGETDKP
jgi:GH43 family beta-xylosidase